MASICPVVPGSAVPGISDVSSDRLGDGFSPPLPLCHPLLHTTSAEAFFIGLSLSPEHPRLLPRGAVPLTKQSMIESLWGARHSSKHCLGLSVACLAVNFAVGAQKCLLIWACCSSTTRSRRNPSSGASVTASKKKGRGGYRRLGFPTEGPFTSSPLS